MNTPIEEEAVAQTSNGSPLAGPAFGLRSFSPRRAAAQGRCASFPSLRSVRGRRDRGDLTSPCKAGPTSERSPR